LEYDHAARRHTCASLSISAGANVKVVQRMLGHATAAMTLDLYGHLLDDDLSPVAEALGKAIETTAVSLRNLDNMP
jgi:integrase